MRAFCFLTLTFFCLTANFVLADDSNESQAMEKIELLGGEVTRDDTLPGRPVIGVNFGRESANQHIALLKSFPSLTTLDLGNIQATDEDVKELKELAKLTSLSLRTAKLTDAGFKEIGAIGSLSSLGLGSFITDSNVREISRLKNLTQLNLSWARISDAGMKELNRLTKLEYLDLGSTKISDHGCQSPVEMSPFLRICPQ